MPAPKLRLPEQNFPALRDLVKLSADERQLVLQMLQRETPSLGLNEMAERLSSISGLDFDKARRIVDFFVNLNAARDFLNLGIPEFVEQLRDAVEAAGKPDLKPDNWSEFGEIIRWSLEDDGALALSSKSIVLIREHQNVFFSARVLTDLRPVFRSEVEAEPAAFLTMHNLKISYDTNAGLDEFFVAMDRNDVVDLIEALQRALQKDDSLKRVATDKGLMVLEALS